MKYLSLWLLLQGSFFRDNTNSGVFKSIEEISSLSLIWKFFFSVKKVLRRKIILISKNFFLRSFSFLWKKIFQKIIQFFWGRKFRKIYEIPNHRFSLTLHLKFLYQNNVENKKFQETDFFWIFSDNDLFK